MPSHRDYAWIVDEAALQSHSVFYVEGARARELREAPSVVDLFEGDIGALVERAAEVDLESARSRIAIGFVRVGDWLVGITPSACTTPVAGVTEIAVDRQLVTHHGLSSVLPMGSLSWFVGGDLLVGFAHQAPFDRWGTEPDRVVTQMREVGGLMVDHPSETEIAAVVDAPACAASLALSESITGVSITRELLHSTTFVIVEMVIDPLQEFDVTEVAPRDLVPLRSPTPPRGLPTGSPTDPGTYAWADADPTFASYCLAYVENVRVDDLMAALPVDGSVAQGGLAALITRSWSTWARHDSDRLTVGLLEVGGWVLVLQIHGHARIPSDFVSDLSRGRSVVEHSYRGDTGLGNVVRYVDGATHTSFTTQYPELRHGARPHHLADLMHLWGPAAEGRVAHLPEPHRAASVFALAESITGVALDPAALRDATFDIAEVVLRPWAEPSTTTSHSRPWKGTPVADLYQHAPRPAVRGVWRDFTDLAEDDETGGATIALVSHADVATVLAALPTSDITVGVDHTTLAELTYDLDDPTMKVGVLQIGEWTALYEINGFVAMHEPLLAPLSLGREIVATYLNPRGGNAQFGWFVDGELRTYHNTLPVDERRGTHPDALLPLAAAISDSDPTNGSFTVDHSRDPHDYELQSGATAIALIAAMTGIRLEASTFRDAEFTVAFVIDADLP